MPLRSWARRLRRADPFTRRLLVSRLVNPLDRWDLLARKAIRSSDMTFLRDYFWPLQAPLEALLKRRIACWEARART